jgi:hypothetical protein
MDKTYRIYVEVMPYKGKERGYSAGTKASVEQVVSIMRNEFMRYYKTSKAITFEIREEN